MMPQAAQTPAPAPLPTLDQSFELLKEFKLGTDSTVLIPIGSAASVPAVTPLILDDEPSVHARNVLEHIPGPESEKALRDALGQAKGRTRIGVINSVAARRDAASTPALIKILGEDPPSAAAAAKALGEIGTSEAAKALAAARG